MSAVNEVLTVAGVLCSLLKIVLLIAMASALQLTIASYKLNSHGFAADRQAYMRMFCYVCARTLVSDCQFQCLVV